MPFGYLFTTGVMAVLVLFALASPQPSRSSTESRSFWLGFMVNELPFLALYLLAASTALAIGQGDIANPVGWIGLGLAVLATAGLVVVVLRALRTGAVVDEALNAAGLPARTPRRLPLRIFFWPFPVPHPGIERISNISYGDAGRANRLDVYRLRSHSGTGPTLVHLHGGAFRTGKKSRETRPLFHRLARRGWVCISANYRLRASYTDPLVDVKKVIAWVREHGPEYGADPNVVFVAGCSAGGHLASMAALTADDTSLQPGFEDVDTSVTAVVSLYGYYGPVGPERSSPMAYDGRGAPPFFVAHPDRDTFVTVEDARRFVESLRKGSVNPVVYAELPGAQHVFDYFYSIRFEAVIDGIEAFADDMLRPTSSPRRPPTAPDPVTESSGSPGRGRGERR
jgi:acetyl esterase/lipase